MTLDKWQVREAAQFARDNDYTQEEAEAELFPAEPAARKRTAAKVDTGKVTETKTPAKAPQ